MRYKPVSIVANGGTYQHHLVIENQLKPILDYFRCLVTPNYVYTHKSHFDENNVIIDNDVHDRLKRACSCICPIRRNEQKPFKEPMDVH